MTLSAVQPLVSPQSLCALPHLALGHNFPCSTSWPVASLHRQMERHGRLLFSSLLFRRVSPSLVPSSVFPCVSQTQESTMEKQGVAERQQELAEQEQAPNG